MLLLSRNQKYTIREVDKFAVALQNEVDVTDSGLPLDYTGGNLFGGINFNQPIGGWDVSNVTTMDFLFLTAVFNQPINGWDVSNVRNMEYMFYSSLYNRPLNSWDVSNVQAMQYMFYNSKYNHPLTRWAIHRDTTINSMFRAASIEETFKPRRCRNVIIE